MSEILVIRHGQGSFGQGDYDNLSQKGYYQSQLLAEYLYNYRYKNKHIDAIYCGTLKRQQQTVETIIKYFNQNNVQLPNPKCDMRLNEYDSIHIIKTIFPVLLNDEPSLEEEIKQIYTDKKAFQRVFERVMRFWVQSKENYEGIETFADVKQRVKSIINEIIQENGRGKNIIIVSSGGIIGAIVQMVLGFDDETTMRLTWQIVNTSMTHLRYNEKELILASFNYFPHIEIANDPSLKTYR
ncbi:MAG: histidine phosphatase family protein [Spirochaetes bacterium]|nr:histidine phosphatase family protein [Spirochaetota bacterium]